MDTCSARVGGPRLMFLAFAVVLIATDGMCAEPGPDRQTEVLLVQIVFRHGDRFPVFPPRNHTNESYPLHKWGQLTHMGMKQQYDMGLFLRDRYAALRLNVEANREELVAKSSPVDRAISSAACLLAGLYRPDNVTQQFDESLPWVPVPVHTLESRTDNYLLHSTPCPVYDNALSKLRASKLWKEGVGKEENSIQAAINEEFGSLITNATNITGITDMLLVERNHNLSLTQASELILTRKLANWKEMHQLQSKLPEYRRLRGGQVLSKIVSNINEHVSRSNTKLKMALFSTHDIVVMSLLATLGRPLEVFPMPMSTAVLVELLADVSNLKNLYVKILFRNDSTRHPYVFTLPGCTSLCPLKAFLRLTKPVIPVDLVKECAVQVNHFNCNAHSRTANGSEKRVPSVAIVVLLTLVMSMI